MLSKEIEPSVDPKSTTPSTDVELDDFNRNHISDGENGQPNKVKPTEHRGNFDGDTHTGKSPGRRGSAFGRARASSITKLTHSVGKIIGSKEESNQHGVNDSSGDKDDYAKPRGFSRTSLNSNADSVGSRESQGTEDDVWFPMEEKQVKVRGIDFGVIDKFIEEEKEHAAFQGQDSRRGSCVHGLASLRYTPENVLKSIVKGPAAREQSTAIAAPTFSEKDDNSDFNPDDISEKDVRFGGTRIADGMSDALPDRFSLFHSKSEETVHAHDFSSLVSNGESIQELFHNGEETWWLDCTCPTDAEMKMLAQAFGIHPLTAEDIRMQETR
ncbi:hypothetical protein KGF57_004395, partial [Candida theae]